MQVSKLEDRTIISNSINTNFLNSLKSNIKNPFSVSSSRSNIKVGMEFEFFIPTQNKTTNEKLDDLNGKIEHLINGFSFYNEVIEVLPNTYELDKNLSHSYLEKDSTLTSDAGEGFEFVSPMLNLKDVPFYLQTTSEAIKDVGYSTNGCGLHFHISSPDMGKIDMAKLMTFLHHKDGLFDGYLDRNQYVKSLERVFMNSKIETFNENIREQTKQYDIVFLSDNHIELRMFGGEDVYDNPKEILNKLNQFLDIYKIACTPSLEDELYKNLVSENISEGHHQLEAASFQSVLDVAKQLAEENKWDLSEAFEEAFNASEEVVLTSDKLIEDYDELYNDSIPTI